MPRPVKRKVRISSECGMHHGTANAVMLPYVLEFNKPAAGARLRELGELFGGGNAADRVRELNSRAGIPPRLRDFGVREDILPALADKAIQDGCHLLNPVPTTRDDLLSLYGQAW